MLLKLSMLSILIISAFCFSDFASAMRIKGASQDLIMTLVPNKSYLLPGSASNCTDLASFKADPTGKPYTSISEARLHFRQFKLQWNSTDPLQVVYVKVTVENENIVDLKYETKIDGEELDALLGFKGGLIDPQKLVAGYLDSSDSARDTNGSEYAPCPFTFGGIELVANAKPFTTTAKVELLGYSTQPDGMQIPVKAVFNADVEHIY